MTTAASETDHTPAGPVQANADAVPKLSGQYAGASPNTIPVQHGVGKDIWQRALEALPDDDKAVITQCRADSRLDLRTLQAALEVRREECENRSLRFEFHSRQVVLRDVTDKIISWINKFKEIGDIAVNYDPVHAALPWAGLRFLLQVSYELSQCKCGYNCSDGRIDSYRRRPADGALLIGAEKVTNLISRCSVYEFLYLHGQTPEQTKKTLENALLKLYVVILRFLTQTNRLFQSSTRRFVRGILSP